MGTYFQLRPLGSACHFIATTINFKEMMPTLSRYPSYDIHVHHVERQVFIPYIPNLFSESNSELIQKDLIKTSWKF